MVDMSVFTMAAGIMYRRDDAGDVSAGETGTPRRSDDCAQSTLEDTG
jgi:hypothetical protein